jgi:hypothetical protein
MAFELSETEVKELVYSYKEIGVTNHLYDFGKLLLTDSDRRSARINSQSVTILGWSTAVLAFLIGFGRHFPPSRTPYLVLLGGVFCLMAVALAFFAIQTRQEWAWPSDKAWIHRTALNTEDALRRHHVRVMHTIKRQRQAVVDRKSWFLFLAEVSLTLAALALFVGLMCSWLFP